MIYEYAVDPALLVTLSDSPDLAWWMISRLGNATGCVLSEYPGDVGSLARKMVKEEREKADSAGKVTWSNRLMLVEQMAVKLKQRHSVGMAKRKDAERWEGSFAREHGRHNFDCILSEQEGSFAGNSIANVFEWLRHDASHIHQCPSSLLVKRGAVELSSAIGPILKNSRSITFIDPYFWPLRDDYKKAYGQYITKIIKDKAVRGTLPRTISIVCDANAKLGGKTYDKDEFAQMCRDNLTAQPNVTITVRRALEKRGNAHWHSMHNRYLITDVGGVVFAHGTDCDVNGNECAHDVLSLMSATDCLELSKIYKPGSNYFDWSEESVCI